MASSKEQILQSAEKFLAKGKLEPALKEYLRLLDENPKDVATLNRVGDLYSRMNRPADSIQYYTRIADSYSLDGFFLKAIAIFKKINKIDPARLDIYEKLADLYQKQGLTQDARSQYQVLADHFQKSGKHEDAIAAYKKMAGVDPNDLKIQARLADLYHSHKQTEQAVMQYGLIGSMLLRRGAHDEAAAVFQKALELSPNDANIQKSLVRSLLAQKNAPAAIAILKAAPRTSDSLALLAEAQLELGNKPDAVKTAEQAIALDARHEGSRTLLCRIRLLEGSFEQAYAAIVPSVDAAVARRDFPRAVGLLAPILEAEPAHRTSLERMAEVREAEGNAAEAASLRVTLGRNFERKADTKAALESYQRALKSQPGNPEALERVRHLAPAAEAQAEPAPAAVREPEKPREPPAAFGVQEVVIDIEPPARPTAPPPPAATSAPTRPPPPVVPPAPAAPAGEAAARHGAGVLDEQEIETLVVEAEVFAKYGLADKAVERLRSLVRRRPDLIHARERLVDLMAESKNSALDQEARGLADLYRGAGRGGDADALLARLRIAAEAPVAAAPDLPAAAPQPQAAALPAPGPSFDEFEIDLSLAAPEPAPPMPAPPPAPAPAPPEEFGEDAIRFSSSDLEPVADVGSEAGWPAPSVAPTPPAAGSDSDFVSYEELGSLLQDEMQKAG
ncbi:MAG TPA: tetratricopeptide repeat protein, partial [Thermoanaerobaculia bacterium]|nr:tetratricopeptide repeat protein [Thermoanaerobaculia bacterium]